MLVGDEHRVVRAVADRRIHLQPNVLFELLQRARVTCDDDFEAVAQWVDHLLDDLFEQPVLGIDVLVHRGFTNTGLGGDITHRRVDEPLALENRSGRVDELLYGCPRWPCRAMVAFRHARLSLPRIVTVATAAPGPRYPPAFSAMPIRGRWDLAGSTCTAAELLGDFDNLGEPGGTKRVAFRQQPTAGIDRQSTAKGGRPRAQELGRVSGRAQPEIFDRDQLGGASGIVALGEIDVIGRNARRLVGRGGGTVNLRSCGRSADRIRLIRHTRPGESRRRNGENRPRTAQVDSAHVQQLSLAIEGQTSTGPRSSTSCAAWL